MTGPIPEKIEHAAFLAAMKPLLDLLNVTDKEIHAGIVIGPSSMGNLGTISFNAVARADGDEAEYPEGQFNIDGLAERPQPFTELAWPVMVEIV